ncbi:MAG: ankyrin repeat domain-containing protein [Candidatus Bilamarchaeaceae archaeon]
MAGMKTKPVEEEAQESVLRNVGIKPLHGKPVKVASLDNPISLEKFMDAAQNGDLKTVMEYVKNGGDVNAKGTMGYTALMLAIENKNMDVVKFLASQPSTDIDMFNDKGFNALTIAIREKNTEAARILLRYGADVNVRDPSTGFTAIMQAVEKRSLEIVELLINRGANLNARVKSESGESEYEGMTALMLSVYIGSNVFAGTTIFDFKAEASAEPFVKMAELLLESGANTKLKDDAGHTAYDYAKGAGLKGKNFVGKWINRHESLVNLFEAYE